MNCRQSRRILLEPLAAGFREDQREGAFSHLTHCASCGAYRAEEAALDRLVASLDRVEAPPDFEAALRRKLAAPATPPAPARNRRAWRFVPIAAAASVALTAGALLLFRLAGAGGGAVGPGGTGAAAPAESALADGLDRPPTLSGPEVVIPIPSVGVSSDPSIIRMISRDRSTGDDMYVEMPATAPLRNFKAMEASYVRDVSH